jgi:molybdate transport system substrate-binding protein
LPRSTTTFKTTDRRRERSLLAGAMLLAAWFVGGCASSDSKADNQRVTILVAASAKEAVEEIAAAFEASSNAKVDVSVGASNALAQQILSGAPADLFLSASEEWADALAQENLVGQRVDLLSNRLVLIVPRGNPAGFEKPVDMLREGVERIALADENVPAGRYAQQALTKLELFEKLSVANKIARGHDVRATLAFVERGEAEAGIVYATDALIASDVEIAYEFDPATHDLIVYPLVLLKAGESNPKAVELFDRLRSPESLAAFQRRGFHSVPSPPAAR